MGIWFCRIPECMRRNGKGQKVCECGNTYRKNMGLKKPKQCFKKRGGDNVRL